MNRQELQESYIQQLIDGMDYKTMERFVYDTLEENLTNYTDEELITEVTDYYPELIEETNWCSRLSIKLLTILVNGEHKVFLHLKKQNEW